LQLQTLVSVHDFPEALLLKEVDQPRDGRELAVAAEALLAKSSQKVAGNPIAMRDAHWERQRRVSSTTFGGGGELMAEQSPPKCRLLSNPSTQETARR
jgi:hypothetical protein